MSLPCQGNEVDLGKPVGVAAQDMTKRQRRILMSLIREYIGTLSPTLSEGELATIKDQADSIYFAWAGGLERGEGHYYRIHGKTFIIEYDNTQNGANHCHAVWHSLKDDFALDTLKNTTPPLTSSTFVIAMRCVHNVVTQRCCMSKRPSVSRSTRREFIRQTSQAAGSIGILGTLGAVHTSAKPPDEPINLAIIGCGGMMSGHVAGLVDRKENVDFSWLCDVDPRQIVGKSAKISEVQKRAPRKTSRFEDIVDDKNVDAAIIATPHHWHTPIAIALMEAGKDVYVEKPISHVYNEGPMMIAAAKKYGRIVQQGSQMRNSPVTKQAQRILAGGLIGDIKVARAWTAETRSVALPVPDSNVPEGVDYDRWLGPLLSDRSTNIVFMDHGGCIVTMETERLVTMVSMIWIWLAGACNRTDCPHR